MEKTYTLKELEEILKVSRITLYRYINAGKLKAFKLNSEWRVKESDLIKYLGGE